MAISLDVNNLKVDGDSINDHVTFRVTQTGEQSFSVRTFVDTSKDGFGKLDSDTTKTFTINTSPQFCLSSLKFQNNRLLLLGKDGSSGSIPINQLIPEATKETSLSQQELEDNAINDLGGLGTKGIGHGTSGYQSAPIDGMGDLQSSGLPIEATLKRHMVILQSAYQRELGQNPNLAGKITIKFVVGKDGRISSAEVASNEMNSIDVGQRMGEKICKGFAQIQFPEPKGNESVTVIYPFEFEPS